MQNFWIDIPIFRIFFVGKDCLAFGLNIHLIRIQKWHVCCFFFFTCPFFFQKAVLVLRLIMNFIRIQNSYVYLLLSLLVFIVRKYCFYCWSYYKFYQDPKIVCLSAFYSSLLFENTVFVVCLIINFIRI